MIPPKPVQLQSHAASALLGGADRAFFKSNMSALSRNRGAKQPEPSLIHVPALFSVVEPGVYRSASPTPAQVPFLATLGLKTIISLTPEFPTKQLLAFTRNAGIDFLHLGTTLWRPLLDWKPMQDEIVKATLEVLLDRRNHPLLLIDPLGIHQTGIIVGCLRAMQGWNFASTLVEYLSHSGPTKHRYSDEQYIELFDPDLINLPLPAYIPSWFSLYDKFNQDDDTDYEGEDEAVSQSESVRADGTIRGEGVAAESALMRPGEGRDPAKAERGVG